MNIVLKNTFKNIFCKPFRTILVVFAIFVCSLCAMLCFDLGSCITKMLTDYLGSVSRADILVFSGGSDISSLPEGFPEADYMTIVMNNGKQYTDSIREYDENGNLIYEETYDEGELYTKDAYTYDADGKLVSSTNWSSYNAGEHQMEYIYDEMKVTAVENDVYTVSLKVKTTGLSDESTTRDFTVQLIKEDSGWRLHGASYATHY